MAKNDSSNNGDRHKIHEIFLIKGELQRENKLIAYERAFKMLENDMYISLDLVKPFSCSQALKSGQGITKGESPYFRNFWKFSVIWGSFHVSSDTSQFPDIKNWDIF